MPATGTGLTVRRASAHGGYGWTPQLPDLRDAKLSIPATTSLPSQVDMSDHPDMPPIYDQGQLNSCTANALAAAVDFDNHLQTQHFLTPSRLWIWYQERLMEGDVGQNAGAQIRDGAKVVAHLGVCPETDWPYNAAAFAEAPPQEDYTHAFGDRVLTYAAVAQDLWSLKSVLAEDVPWSSGSPCIANSSHSR